MTSLLQQLKRRWRVAVTTVPALTFFGGRCWYVLGSHNHHLRGNVKNPIRDIAFVATYLKFTCFHCLCGTHSLDPSLRLPISLETSFDREGKPFSLRYIRSCVHIIGRWWICLPRCSKRATMLLCNLLGGDGLYYNINNRAFVSWVDALCDIRITEGVWEQD